MILQSKRVKFANNIGKSLISIKEVPQHKVRTARMTFPLNPTFAKISLLGENKRQQLEKIAKENAKKKQLGLQFTQEKRENASIKQKKRIALYKSNNYKFSNLINNQNILQKFDEITKFILNNSMKLNNNLKKLFTYIQEQNLKVNENILQMLDVKDITELSSKSPLHIKNLLITIFKKNLSDLKEEINKNYYLYNFNDNIIYNKIQHNLKPIRDKIKIIINFLKNIKKHINEKTNENNKELFNNINDFYLNLLNYLKELNDLLLQNQKNNKEKINIFRNKRKMLK